MEFPEIEAAACGSLFYSAHANDQRWIPVFVFSKSHLKIGFVFEYIRSRWAYSEIHCFEKIGNFSALDQDDILCHLRFALFFLQSAEFHRSQALHLREQVLVDRSGRALLRKLTVIGDRVLKG